MVIELRLYLTDDPDEEPRIITHSSDQAPNTLILDVEPAVDGLDLPLSCS